MGATAPPSPLPLRTKTPGPKIDPPFVNDNGCAGTITESFTGICAETVEETVSCSMMSR